MGKQQQGSGTVGEKEITHPILFVLEKNMTVFPKWGFSSCVENDGEANDRERLEGVAEDKIRSQWDG